MSYILLHTEPISHTHVLIPDTYIKIVQYSEKAHTMAIYLNVLLQGKGASMSLLRVLHSFSKICQTSASLNCLFDTGRREGRLLWACAMWDARAVASGQIINKVRCLRKQNAVMGMCKCRKWLVPDQWRPVGTYWTWSRGYSSHRHLSRRGHCSTLYWGHSPLIVSAV